MARKKDSSKPQWKASVTFVPFENEAQRNKAYRAWVRLFLKTRKREVHAKGQESA